MSQITTITKPKQAKKTLKSIAQGTITGPPEQIESLRLHCLRIINNERAEVIHLKTEKNDS